MRTVQCSNDICSNFNIQISDIPDDSYVICGGNVPDNKTCGMLLAEPLVEDSGETTNE